jgi:hypothetical protein
LTMNISYADLVWISESSPITIYREADYPPLRGTMISLGKEALLFTRGNVPGLSHISRLACSPSAIAAAAHARQAHLFGVHMGADAMSSAARRSGPPGYSKELSPPTALQIARTFHLFPNPDIRSYGLG